ncbi:DNA sulfur modification protein DndB [Lentibacillus saliphilus]|uniref:DNA sulfur modification protein DndB n=1 Tax=Lentibacillus saliphilus TaxID=2737028 RepID=UPI001C310C54|nr:DNA sulfur modification protein DndB [Lentibacillus saliphilus]
MKSLKEIASNRHSLTFNAVRGNQFGQNVITIQCTAEQIIKFIEIDKDVQRELIEDHVTNIQRYIQYGLEGNDIYFPPLLFSSRGKGAYDKELGQFNLRLNEKLVVLDGQHRIKAFEMIIGRLEAHSTPTNLKHLQRIKNFPLTIQIFTDLSIKQERQLFTDINTKSSKVSNTLLIMYKNENLCAELTKQIILSHPSISEDKFETRGRSTRSKLMTAATLNNIIITLNEGVLNTSLSEGKITKDSFEQYKENTEKFLNSLVKYAPANSMDRTKQIIYIPSVLYGIAYFVFIALEKYPYNDIESLFEKVIRKVDWTHKNKDFLNLGIPYKQTTGRYNFSNGIRGSRLIAEYLYEKLEDGKEKNDGVGSVKR